MKKLLILLGFLPTIIVAQGSVEFYQNDDAENFYVQRYINPNIVVHGDFGYYYHNYRGSFLGQDKGFSNSTQFNLSLESVLFADTSFFLKLRNKQNIDGTEYSNYSYYTFDDKQQSAVQQGNSLDLEAYEYYLDYRVNPLVKFLIGRQTTNIADHMGLVYNEQATGLTQTCAISSWCYYIGAAVTGAKNGGLRFWHISYPFFDQLETKTSYWGQVISKNKVQVEVYSTYYNDYHSPLAQYGGSTIKPNYDKNDPYSKFQVVDNNNNHINRDQRWQYWGMNFSWQMAPYYLDLKYVKLAGTSLFYSEDANHTNSFIDSKSNSASATYGEISYTIAEQFRLKGKLLTTTGNKQQGSRVSSDRLTGVDQNFYEVNKGSYSAGNLYFSGQGGFGQGHSVSNITYFNLNFAFITQAKIFSFDIDYYNLQRTKEIVNANGKGVKNIGQELDLNFNFLATKNLTINPSFSMFFTGNAYSENDNIVPASSKADSFSALDLNIKYSF